MWFFATIAGYRSLHVWFIDDRDMISQKGTCAPGMYLLKGETNLYHLGAPLRVRTRRLVVPTSYMKSIDCTNAACQLNVGVPVPIECVCVPILTTVANEWIDPSICPFIHFLTQYNNEVSFEKRCFQPVQEPVPKISLCRPKHLFAMEVLDVIFNQHKEILPFCDMQLRKAVFLGVMDQNRFSSDIYCIWDDCFSARPCHAHDKNNGGNCSSSEKSTSQFCSSNN